MSVNHKVVYVPFGKDANGEDMIYPTYVPIVVNEPEVLMATGSLSESDYNATKEILHADQAGFPFAPLIAALAPIVLPAAVKLAKNIFTKKSEGGYIPTNPNIRNLKDLQELYDTST